MFICNSLKQPLHNYGVYKTAGKEGGEAASTASQGTSGQTVQKVTRLLRQVTGKQTRFRNDRTVHSLQQPTLTKHWGCQGKNCGEGKIQAFQITWCQRWKQRYQNTLLTAEDWQCPPPSMRTAPGSVQRCNQVLITDLIGLYRLH